MLYGFSITDPENAPEIFFEPLQRLRAPRFIDDS